MEHYYEANVRIKPLLIQQNSTDNETKTLGGRQSKHSPTVKLPDDTPHISLHFIPPESC